MKLWIDDFRDAPDGWIEARKVESAIKAILQFRPTTISLDHDIENRPDDETFKPVAYFIGELYNNDMLWADDLEVTIHSDNPVGAKELQKILEHYGIIAEWKPYTSHAAFKEKFELQ
jgi:hypothetical protein